MTRRAYIRGFTLIEVLVAMVVAAIGIGALLSTLAASADTVSRLREKTFAEWIALNHLSDTRLQSQSSGSGTSIGVTTGEIEYANTKWKWRQEITDPGVSGILRIEVSVARSDAKDIAKAKDADDKFPAAARAYGFIGTSVSAANGIEPSWILPKPRNPGTP